MIGPLFWLICLLTYSDTERTLLGRRRRSGFQWFGVNVGFSNEDKILIKILYVLKFYEAKLIEEFPKKGWGLNKLLKKLQGTGTTAGQSGSTESIQNVSCFSIM